MSHDASSLRGELDRLRAMMGRKLRLEQWNTEATADAIRHYAHGIGDDNPLFSDPAYAAAGPYGTLIAPPTFLYSVYDAVVAPGLPEHSWFYAGADWTFHHPVRLGTRIKAEAELTGLRETTGGRVQGLIVETGRTSYSDTDGQLLATVDAHCFRVPLRQDGKGGMPFQHRPQHSYSDAELQRIEAMVLGEYRRGPARLRWSELAVGQSLPELARGPLVPIDMSTYYAGAIGTAGYKSTKMRWLNRHYALHDPSRLPETLPAAYFVQGLAASMGHSDPKAAAAGGMPGAYDNGLQRLAFMLTLVTNWMGDHGWLRRSSVRIKAPVIYGDTTFVKGEIQRLHEEDGTPVVTIALRAENQFGEVTATGEAEVALPPDSR